MTLDAHVTGIWCGQIGGGVGISRNPYSLSFEGNATWKRRACVPP